MKRSMMLTLLVDACNAETKFYVKDDVCEVQIELAFIDTTSLFRVVSRLLLSWDSINFIAAHGVVRRSTRNHFRIGERDE